MTIHIDIFNFYDLENSFQLNWRSKMPSYTRYRGTITAKNIQSGMYRGSVERSKIFHAMLGILFSGKTKPNSLSEG